MGKIESYKKYIFSVLTFLSAPVIWHILVAIEVTDLKKILMVSLTLIYVFMISEYIEGYFYHKFIRNMFSGVCYTPSAIYKLFYSILPFCSLLIYTATWLSYIHEPTMDTQTIGMLLIMSGSILSFSLHFKYVVVFADKEHIFLCNKIISISDVESYNNYNKKIILGLEVGEVKICTKSGEKYILQLNKNSTNKFCNIFSNN